MTDQTRAQQQRDLGPALDITAEHRRSLADPWDRHVQDWSVTAVAIDLDTLEDDPPSQLVCATGELREDRLNADALFGGNALIAITEVEVEPAYAGLDVDQLLTLEAISLLGGGCDLAAMITLDPRRVPRTVASLNSNRLRRFWREAGFESVTQQVMVLYLAMATLEKHLHRLRTSFALLP